MADTACGARLPSNSAVMSPQVVLRDSVQFLPPASEAGGALANCFGLAGGCTVTAGQALAGLLAAADDVADGVAELLDVTAGVAVEELSSCLSNRYPPPTTATTARAAEL